MTSSQKFITRAYNKIKHYPTLGIIEKSSNNEKLYQEYLYYKALPRAVQHYFPKIISGYKLKKINYLKMEFFPYQDLGKIMVFENFNSKLWNNIANYIDNILIDFRNHSKKSNINFYDLEKMYIHKTEKEFNNFINMNNKFKKLCDHENLIINNKSYKNFKIIWPHIKELVYKKYLRTRSDIIHGDMCLSNILMGRNGNEIGLKLIDPRGSFGNLRFKGDQSYDIAKLSHSFSGYEYIIFDQFKLIQLKSNNFTLNLCNKNNLKIKSVFEEKVFKSFEIEKCDIIEGTIFIGMCARHYDSPKRQIAMYLTGIKILNRIFERI